MPLEDEDHTADLWEDPSQGGALGRILEASETGDASVLAVALPTLSVSVDSTGPDGDTALHLASLYGHTQCVQMLLGAGANVAVRDADGGTPLHDACAGGFETIVGKLLAAAGPAGGVALGERGRRAERGPRLAGRRRIGGLGTGGVGPIRSRLSRRTTRSWRWTRRSRRRGSRCFTADESGSLDDR